MPSLLIYKKTSTVVDKLGAKLEGVEHGSRLKEPNSSFCLNQAITRYEESAPNEIFPQLGVSRSSPSFHKASIPNATIRSTLINSRNVKASKQTCFGKQEISLWF